MGNNPDNDHGSPIPCPSRPVRAAVRTGSLSALVVLLASTSVLADGPPAFRGRIAPMARIVIELGPEAGPGSLLEGEPFAIGELAEQALDRAPAWIRDRLEVRFADLAPEIQDELAQLILDLDDPRLVDEVAFSIAAVSLNHLLSPYFRSQALVDNAEAIYAVDEQLGYVEIVDVGQPDLDDDFHSFTRYRMLTLLGYEREYELPPEIYYWYVAMPTFGAEPLTLVDPVTGDPADPEEGGVFWRDYYLYQDPDPKRCASTHFGMEYPTLIEESMVDGWGPSAQGALVDFEIDPLPLVVDPASGDPVLAVFSYPGGTYDANYIATTMPLELAYREGRPELLENMLSLGNSNAYLPLFSYVAVIKDRDPFGEPTVEQALADLGFDYVDVFTSDQIADVLDLTPQYTKIIVPSGQPRELYQALADAREAIDEWLIREIYGLQSVFQFHGAVDPSQPGDVWFDLNLPGGFTCTDQATDAIDDLDLGGFPWLLDVLAQTDHVVQWQLGKQSWGGALPWEPEGPAVRALGYFGTQHIQDRCAEIPPYYQGPDNQDFGGNLDQVLRSPYPQRTLYLHFGNCGESQDILGASTRAALLPNSSVGSFVDDHVWNLTYIDGQWTTFTIFRSDGGTSFGPTTYWGEDSWASVLEWRGDGMFGNRTAMYTPVVTLDVTVTDSRGRPVDGASVVVASDAHNTDPDTLIYAAQAWTDKEGKVSIDLGAGRNYYAALSSPAGLWPGPDPGQVTQVLEKEQDQPPGEVYPIDVQLEDDVPGPWEVEPAQPVDGETVPVRVRLDAYQSALEASNTIYNLTFREFDEQGTAELVLVDAANFQLLEGGQPFEALARFEAADLVDETIDVPRPVDGGSLYLVASNAARYGHALFAEVDAEVLATDQPPTKGGSDESCGCATAGARDGAAGSLLELLLGALSY